MIDQYLFYLDEEQFKKIQWSIRINNMNILKEYLFYLNEGYLSKSIINRLIDQTKKNIIKIKKEIQQIRKLKTRPTMKRDLLYARYELRTYKERLKKLITQGKI